MSDLTKGLLAALVLASPVVGADTKYPAADFQPGVVYKDEKLIEQHNAAAKEQKSTPAPVVESKVEELKPVAAQAADDDDAVAPVSKTTGGSKEAAVGNLPIALVVLAIGGFAFWSSRKGTPKAAEPEPEVAAPVISGSPGETGVAKYLKSMPEVPAALETGVAKYLRTVIANAPAALQETGVARYLKNLPDTAASGETGVAKYLKNIK